MADLEALGNLGSEFTLLHKAVIEAVTDNTNMFRPIFENLKITLDSLHPYVKEKAEHDISDQVPGEELELFRINIEKGIELVRKSSKLRVWSVYQKYKYSKKLLALDKSLQNLVDALRLHTLRYVGKTWNSVKNRETVVAEMTYWNTGPELPSFTVGMDVALMEVKMKLLKDSMSMLILTGPGGCGKTTLAITLCQETEIKDQFGNNIVFVTFAKQPSLSLILQQINQHMGSKILDFKDGVISGLNTFVKEEGQSLLLIFDDVWSGSKSLLELFIPKEGKQMPNYKILVTSRFEFAGLGSSFQLNLLNDEDSMTLFRHSAALRDEGLYVPVNLQREIVKHCKGLPLAILVVGKSLCGKPIEIWLNTLLQWSKGSSILDSENALLFRLQSSLDDLGEENHILLECFIDLTSFPEGEAIPVPALIDMWAELYDLRDITCIANLYKLTARSLVNIVVRRKVEEGYYSEHFVTQHHMLRSLAIHQTRRDPVLSKRVNIDICGDDLPKWWTEQKKNLEKTRLLSISTDEMFSTKWPIMQLPTAEVLVLNMRTENFVLLPKFIGDMDKSLKVLIVINYGSLPAEISHFHLLSSLSNLKTIRLHCISIPSFTKNPIQLKSLQKISFFMCNISQAFRKGAIPISHAMPILVEINIDYCNDLVEWQVDDICTLVHLKKLTITNCHKLSALPEEIGKLLNLEVLRLSSCTDLVKLPGSIRNLKKLNFLDISHCFSIRELPEEIGELGSLRKLNLRDCSRLQELPESFLNLEGLEEVICDKYTQALWEPFLPTFKSMVIRVVKEEINLNWLQNLQF